MNWCEAEACGWIVNPAGTWSNLAYLLFAVLMWREARRTSDPTLGLFAPASFAVGVFSFVYHASYTALLQFFDFVGMFLFCFVVVTANALRLGWIGPERRWTLLVGGTVVTSALVPVVSRSPVPIQAMVAVLIAVILAQEAAVARREPPGGRLARRGVFFLALALIAGAGVASALDVSRVWCDPTSWMQGHALWHVLSAASLYALFRYYAGLTGTGEAPPDSAPRGTERPALASD